MDVGDALPLDPVDPAGGDVEQDVHQVVGQQVDLVDVEDARRRPRPAGRGGSAARRRSGPRPRSSDPDHPVLGRPQRAARRTGRARGAARPARGPGWTWRCPSRRAAARRRSAGRRREQERQLRRRPARPPRRTAARHRARSARAAVTASADSSHRLRPPAPRPAGSARAARSEASPQAPLDRLQQPLGHGPQGPRVRGLEELADLRVGHVGLGHPFVHPVLDHPGGGVVAEEVVDGGRHLERALVAVALSWRRSTSG